MPTEPDRPIPPYLRILTSLRSQIESGDLAPNTPVPGERELSEQWNVARATAAKALAMLRSEELIETVPGIGTFVRARLLSSGGDRFRRQQASGSLYRPGETAEITSAELATAPPWVADAWGLPADAVVIHRHRTIRDAHGIVALSTSYYPAEWATTAPALLVTEPVPGGGVRYVEDRVGSRRSRGRDTLSARLATDDEATRLGVELPAAVQVARAMLWNTEGDLIELGEDVSPAGRMWSTDYEITT